MERQERQKGAGRMLLDGVGDLGHGGRYRWRYPRRPGSKAGHRVLRKSRPAPQPPQVQPRARYLASRPSLMDIERDRANHCCRAGKASMLRLGAIFVVLCMVLIAASHRRGALPAGRPERLGIDDRRGRGADRARDLQCRHLPLARPLRRRRPDRRPVPRHRRPRPPGGRARPPDRGLEGQGDKIIDGAAEKTRDRHRGGHRRTRRARHAGEATRRDRGAA